MFFHNHAPEKIIVSKNTIINGFIISMTQWNCKKDGKKKFQQE